MAHEAFDLRQHAALERLDALGRFYGAHACRMSRLHGLVSAVVVLNRFPGTSETFAEIGARLHPVTHEGAPRGEGWAAYARACELGRALDVRDELWIAANAVDVREVVALGLPARFEEEAAGRDEPIWKLMRRHMASTLGARRFDGDALAGESAYETAIASAMQHSLTGLLRDGGSLLLRTFGLGLHGLLLGGASSAGLPSYRSVAGRVLAGSFAALSTVTVWRKGLREASRGESASSTAWPILAQTLGEQVSEVHPAVVDFYSNPAHYDVTCNLELFTAPAHVWSWMLTIFAGQGLFEASPRTYAARIRTYRRADGSMHFVREIDTGSALRVFDSDFLVREYRGVPSLFERFPDVNLEYELTVSSLGPGRGVSVRGGDLFWRGFRTPSTGLQVEFTSEVAPSEDGTVLVLDGVLAMRPRTSLGRFVVRRILRRPERLGRLRYTAVRRVRGQDECPWPFLA